MRNREPLKILKRSLFTSLFFILLTICFPVICLAEYQRLGVPAQGSFLNVSSKGNSIKAFCLDLDLEEPPSTPIPYHLISQDAKIVYVGRNIKPISIKDAITYHGLKMWAATGLSGYEIRFTSRTPLKIDLRNSALAFSETEGSADDPNKVEDEVFAYLKNIKPKPETENAEYYQRKIWEITHPLSLLRESDFWEGRKDHVTPKRKGEAEKRARDDLQVSPTQNIYEILSGIALPKYAPNREARLLARKNSLREINLARSSLLSPFDYLRDPKNSPSLVAYEKKRDTEVFVQLSSSAAGGTAAQELSLTVYANNKLIDYTFGVSTLQEYEIDTLRLAAKTQPGTYGIYATRGRLGRVNIFIGEDSVTLTKEEMEAFSNSGVVPEKLRAAIKNLKGVPGQKPQLFLSRSMVYQGRLGDLSNDGRPSALLDKWFVNPNELMTAFCRAFKNEADIWLTNDIQAGMKNVASLPTVGRGSQIGIFKGGVLDPQGDIASVERELRKDYGVQFITKGKNRPTESDLVVFVAHNDGRDGSFADILNKAIQQGLLENRIVVLGICGTGTEADFAHRIIREGKARAVVYFDKKISSTVLTDVLITLVKVAKTDGFNGGNLEALWQRTMERVSDSVKANVEQFSIIECPRFLAVRLEDNSIEIFYDSQNSEQVRVRKNGE
jgi:hypothetical protein